MLNTLSNKISISLSQKVTRTSCHFPQRRHLEPQHFRTHPQSILRRNNEGRKSSLSRPEPRWPAPQSPSAAQFSSPVHLPFPWMPPGTAGLRTAPVHQQIIKETEWLQWDGNERLDTWWGCTPQAAREQTRSRSLTWQGSNGVNITTATHETGQMQAESAKGYPQSLGWAQTSCISSALISGQL